MEPSESKLTNCECIGFTIAVVIVVASIILLIIGLAVGLPQKTAYQQRPWVQGRVVGFEFPLDQDLYYHPYVVIALPLLRQNCTWEDITCTDQKLAAEWQAIKCIKNDFSVNQTITVANNADQPSCEFYDSSMNSWLVAGVMGGVGIVVGLCVAGVTLVAKDD